MTNKINMLKTICIQNLNKQQDYNKSGKTKLNSHLEEIINRVDIKERGSAHAMPRVIGRLGGEEIKVVRVATQLKI